MLTGGLAALGTATARSSEHDRGPTVTQRVARALDRGAITADVKTRLLADDRTRGFDINVGTRIRRGHATVILEGTAPSRDSKRAATQIAARVSGVDDVDNRLVVTRDRTRNARTVSARTKRALDHD